MIEGEEDYWVAPDGTIHKVGDIVPVIRLPGIVLFNEQIIKGTCDMCEWAIIAPATLAYEPSQSHMATHLMSELIQEFHDEFKHPDFKE